jgi:sugar lactone lactonase YvrE
MKSNETRPPVPVKSFVIIGLIILLAIANLAALVYYFWPFSNVNAPLAKVQTLAGTGEARFSDPFGLAVDKSGAVFVADGDHGKIWRIEKNGAANLVTDKLDTPSGLAFDVNDALIVADAGTHTIKQVNVSNGEINTLAGVEGKFGFADGAASSALFDAPLGVAVSNDGRIYVADTYNDRIRVIENGSVRTIAGSIQGFADGLQAQFNTPGGIAVAPNGEIIVADTANRRIRKIDANGAVSTIAGNGEYSANDGFPFQSGFVEPIGVAVDKKGVIYVSDAGANSVRVIGQRFVGTTETLNKKERGFADGNLTETQFNRPSGVAVDQSGNVFIADTGNQIVRAAISVSQNYGNKLEITAVEQLKLTAEQMRSASPPRWPYNPPEKTREIAGTFGEIRGKISAENEEAYFHNGLDIAGGYGEEARFVRSEKVLRLLPVQEFGTLREMIRMPTLGYIHIRLGRDQNEKPFGDERFKFILDANGKITGVRIRRGIKFQAGDRIGTLNPMNHVHLIAGMYGAEMNALSGLDLPGVKDTVAPKIEEIKVFGENWGEIPKNQPVSGNLRIVARAFDQMDGNAARRRLGVFRLGYQLLQNNGTPASGWENPKTTLSFERLPEAVFAKFVYANGSQSGATGETVFNYIITNELNGGTARESFVDTKNLPNGDYRIRVFAADFFNNQTTQELAFKVNN